MGLPLSVARISFMGQLSSGEQFVTSHWVRANDVISADDANALALAAYSAYNNLLATAVRAMISPTESYNEIRVHVYRSGGPNADLIGTYAVSHPGTGASTDHLPLQTCIVATLKTGFAGRSYRGRMYWPMTCMSLTNHQLVQTQIDSLANGLKQYFDTLNALPVDRTPAVVSQVGTGHWTAISSVSVDSRPDIQRRRAHQQAELFQKSVAIV